MGLFRKYRIEKGRFGDKIIVESKISSSLVAKINQLGIREIELNESFGFSSDGTLDFLKDVERVDSLRVVDFRLKDVSALSSLTSIRDLSVISYCNSKITFSQFENLETCQVIWSLTDDSLFNLGGLKQLYVDGYDGENCSKFANLQLLEELTIINSKIRNVHDLHLLKSLSYLVLVNCNQIESLNGLNDLAYLCELDIEGCGKISDLHDLANLRKLTHLNISNLGAIESLSPLADLINIRSLYFYENTNVVDGDVAVLKSMQNLQDLRFMDRRHYNAKRSELISYRE